MVSDIDDVKTAINSDSIAIINSRSKDRNAGKIEPFENIAGHILTSINFLWMNLVIDGKIMSLKEIKKYFTPLEKYKEIIVHCGSGITGTINYLWKKQA
ncbi:sulfurtransferase [Anaerosalibacter massiliensis]|uniref:sulfurtransferase n=1 Tax=Anaerosalibacter massiliensis TaxID=1347392 RepID=UPI0034CD926A